MIESLRIPPQSAEAEQSVVGGLMLAPNRLQDVKALLSEADFYRRDHRLIYRAILELAGKGQPFDAVTLGEWFEAGGHSEAIGGTGYLIELASNTPSAANIKAYAEIVREKALLRKLIEAGTEIVQSGFSPEGRTAVEVHSEAMRGLLEIRPEIAKAVDTMRDGLRGMVEDMTRWYDGGGTVAKFGVESLDELIGGMEGGDLVLLGARPSMGKTALALQAAVTSGRTLIASMEMASRKLAARLTAHVGKLPSNWIRKPADAPEGALARVTAASAEASKLPILIYDRRLTVDAFCALARKLHSEEPLALVIADHLDLFLRANKRRDDLELGEITKALKSLAKELNAPVLLLVQLNRGVESRTDKRPVMSDIREAGGAEQDADIVVMLYRDEYYHENSTNKGYAEMIVRKARDGELGTRWAKAILSEMRFESSEEQQRSNSSVVRAVPAGGFRTSGGKGQGSRHQSGADRNHG
jgi:replicative DNA helicase